MFLRPGVFEGKATEVAEAEFRRLWWEMISEAIEGQIMKGLMQ